MPDEIRWRAVHSDGTWLEEDHRPGGTYAAIDRARLARFELYESRLSLQPVYVVDVAEGSRLIYRIRRFKKEGVGELPPAVVISIESADRALVDLHVLIPDGAGTLIDRRDHYCPEPCPLEGRPEHFHIWAPQLYPCEV